jgi:hypothetical protein
MTTTSMIMAITEAFHYAGEVPVPEPINNDGEGFQQLAILFLLVPLISLVISFFILYIISKNITRSIIGAIIGSILTFIITIGFQTPMLIAMLIGRITGNFLILSFAVIIFNVSVITFIGWLIAVKLMIKKDNK